MEHSAINSLFSKNFSADIYPKLLIEDLGIQSISLDIYLAIEHICSKSISTKKKMSQSLAIFDPNNRFFFDDLLDLCIGSHTREEVNQAISASVAYITTKSG